MDFEQHDYVWKHDAEAVKLPNWASVKRFRAALEKVSASHFGAIWEGLRFSAGEEVVAVTIDLGDRPLSFHLYEDRGILSFEVPLLRDHGLHGDGCHPVFVLSTLQRRYNLLTFALESEHSDTYPSTLLVGYNNLSFEGVVTEFANFFPDLTCQIASTLEDLEQHEADEKRKKVEFERRHVEVMAQTMRRKEEHVKQRPAWMKDEAYQRHLRYYGHALHEPDYARLGINEADIEKYLVVRNNVWQKTLLVEKLPDDRRGLSAVYSRARDVFEDAKRYTVTVLYGSSWEEIIKAHAEYADGKPE